jgi:hypothetical protein
MGHTSKLARWVVFTTSIPNSHLSTMNIPTATVVVAVALGAVTLRFAVAPPVPTIAVLLVTRGNRKRVWGAGSYVFTPTHD